MKKIESLWPERLREFISEIRRYFKYMLNDHMKFVLIFGGGAAIYYYSQWVKGLSPDFPVGAVMAVILGLTLTICPIATLLKEADIVFLLPLEEKLTGYFNKGIRLSFVIQAYILLLVSAALMPLYFHEKGGGLTAFVYLFAVLLLLKYWNVLLKWDVLKLNGPGATFFEPVVRFSLNSIFLYFLIAKADRWFVLAAAAIMLAYTLCIKSLARDKGIQWESLIEKERARMQVFYRAANMFTDVPHVKSRVWRRKWMDPILHFIPYGRKNTYRYLYGRTIVRTSEYSGLILRLTAIACILLFFISNLYISIAVALLFIYLTGFQLLPMFRRHEPIIWIHLYPVPKAERRAAFLEALIKVLLFQAILMGAASLLGGHLLNGLLAALAGMLFGRIFANSYAANRIKKLEH